MCLLSLIIVGCIAVAAKKDKGWSFEDDSEDDEEAAAQQLPSAASGARETLSEGAAPGMSLAL